MSDDGQHALTIIAFIGSVFSPYYALARRRGPADPENHCAFNVAFYGPRAARWAMTERGRGALVQDPSSLSIGPSALRWDGTTLTVNIDEVTAPLPSRVRGTVRLHPGAMTDRAFTLDPAGRHRWWPIAPAARVEVAMEKPALRWSGAAYLDTNGGDGPLEHTFAEWHWSCARLPEGAAILYDVTHRDGGGQSLALRVGDGGGTEQIEPPPPVSLPRTRLWRLPRETRADAGHAPQVRTALEDAPFYARSVLSTRLLGHDALAVHESLSLDRFRNPLVQAMLPFRMPRRAGR